MTGVIVIVVEERQVVPIALPDARMRVLAGKPVLKLGEGGVYAGLLFEEVTIESISPKFLEFQSESLSAIAK